MSHGHTYGSAPLVGARRTVRVSDTLTASPDSAAARAVQIARPAAAPTTAPTTTAAADPRLPATAPTAIAGITTMSGGHAETASAAAADDQSAARSGAIGLVASKAVAQTKARPMATSAPSTIGARTAGRLSTAAQITAATIGVAPVRVVAVQSTADHRRRNHGAPRRRHAPEPRRVCHWLDQRQGARRAGVVHGVVADRHERRHDRPGAQQGDHGGHGGRREDGAPGDRPSGHWGGILRRRAPRCG